MKKGRLFANIIYYLFTFLIGLVLAFTLPYFYMYYGESVTMIKESLENGEYEKAYSIVGGYYHKDYVFQTDFEEGGGIVLFSAATLTNGYDENGEEVTDLVLHNAYGGFIYGVRDSYKVTATGDNQAKLVVTDKSGAKHDIKVLDSDTDGDGKLDTVATCYEYGFIYIDLDQDTCHSISKISLIDVTGNVYKDIDVSLDYSEQIFTDVAPFLEEYNRDYKSDKLNGLYEEFMSKDEGYAMSSDGVLKSPADKKAAIIVIVYFIGVYVIGDIFLGGRYIIKFFKWLLVKVFKVKFKSNKPKKSEVFGHDYFCKVTLQADVSEIEGFDGSVSVRYSNENGEISFVLLKSNSYCHTQQIKAGDYLNLWVDLDSKYEAVNLPETLEVEGYQKQIIFKIIKRED